MLSLTHCTRFCTIILPSSSSFCRADDRPALNFLQKGMLLGPGCLTLACATCCAYNLTRSWASTADRKSGRFHSRKRSCALSACLQLSIALFARLVQHWGSQSLLTAGLCVVCRTVAEHAVPLALPGAAGAPRPQRSALRPIKAYRLQSSTCVFAGARLRADTQAVVRVLNSTLPLGRAACFWQI